MSAVAGCRQHSGRSILKARASDMCIAAVICFLIALACAIGIFWPVNNANDALGVRLGCAAILALIGGIILGLAALAN